MREDACADGESLASGSIGMDALQAFLEELKRLKVVEGHFLGLLHILIGRKIARADGTLISGGMTWRDLALALRKVRWDREAAQELAVNLADVPPRDRERFWYIIISRAGVDSDRARAAGDTLAAVLAEHDYVIGPPPGGSS